MSSKSLDDKSETTDDIKDKKLINPGKFLVKIYEPRNSTLTDLFIENKHVKSAYNLGVALFVGTILSTAATEYTNKGRVYLGFRTINYAFRNLNYVIFIWPVLFLSSLAVYYSFSIWVRIRIHLKIRYVKHSSISFNIKKAWDLLCLALFVLYYPSLLYFAYKAVLICDLGIASSLTVVMEGTRFLMKTYAFVRTISPKYLQETGETLYPTLAHYIYFLFAPVLVYKDTYPRSNNPIRWKFVGVCFLEFILCIIFYSIVFEKTFIFRLNDYGITTYTWINILTFIVQHFYVGLILSLLFFYSGLHCYLNITAELLRFSDRLFYKDWWTARNPDECLRKWNVFIHDWLYTYIYKDLYENVFPNNKILSKLAVFFISALFHDYIVCVSGRLFIPITSMLYLIPSVTIPFQNINNNSIFGVLLWLGLALTISANFTILSVEYFARVNCPLREETFYDYIKPRMFYC